MKSIATLLPDITLKRSVSIRDNCQAKCDFLNRTQGHLNETDGIDCPLCRNNGHIFIPKENDGIWEPVMKRCTCYPMRQTVRELQRNGLENVVDEYTLDKYICTTDWQKTVKSTAERYLAEDDQPWFYFGGASGCGKSHICTAIAVELLKRGQRLKYMVWRTDATRLKQLINDPIEYALRMKELTEVDTLYIDDLFKTGKAAGQAKQMPTQADINLAFEILNKRYMSRKCTIISSESTLSELLDIDEAIGGRIKQMCGSFCLRVAGSNKNYRTGL